VSKIPKHEQAPRKVKKPQHAATDNVTKAVVTGPMSDFTGRHGSIQHDINHVAGMDGIEASLDNLVTAVYRLSHDDHTVGLALCQNRYGGPIKLTLSDGDGYDMTERLVEAVERIADSVAKLAGLTRPRLESWHGQDEYEPRYREGGAPGPASKGEDGGAA
jgi:hypothetical protein